jgi:hypothetical protein
LPIPGTWRQVPLPPVVATTRCTSRTWPDPMPSAQCAEGTISTRSRSCHRTSSPAFRHEPCRHSTTVKGSRTTRSTRQAAFPEATGPSLATPQTIHERRASWVHEQAGSGDGWSIIFAHVNDSGLGALRTRTW